MLTDLDVLRTASAVIRERGWHQGTYFDEAEQAEGVPVEQCAVCALAALNVAAGKEPDAFLEGVAETAAQWLYLVLEPMGIKSIHEWNDAGGRTADEVLEVFERAAELVQAPEGLTL